MKQLFILLGIISIFNTALLAQEDVFLTAEELPTFPTCEADLNLSCTNAEIKKFITENMQYPKIALKNSVEGICVISFIVEKDGSLSNFKIVRNVGAGLGEEALRILKDLPNFNAGKNDGKNVRVIKNVPVKFHIKEWKKLQKAKKRAARN